MTSGSWNWYVNAPHKTSSKYSFNPLIKYQMSAIRSKMSAITSDIQNKCQYQLKTCQILFSFYVLVTKCELLEGMESNILANKYHLTLKKYLMTSDSWRLTAEIHIRQRVTFWLKTGAKHSFKPLIKYQMPAVICYMSAVISQVQYECQCRLQLIKCHYMSVSECECKLCDLWRG